jgi:hypothetical protein
MNALLGEFKREVEAFPLPSRPDLKIYLLRLTAGESMQYTDRLAALRIEDATERVFPAACISAHVCDAEGKLLLTEEEAAKFVFRILPNEVRSLIKAAARLNGLGDEALEGAEKN